MKFSKTVLIVLGVVVFGVACGLLYMAQSRQLDEQAQLKARMAADQATLTRLATDRQKVQAELVRVQEELARKQDVLAAATAALNKAKAVWPTRPAQSIEYGEKLFALAKGWNLVINVVTAAEPAERPVQGQPFLTNTFQVSVTGQPVTQPFTKAFDYQDYVYQVVGDILGFLGDIVKDDYFATSQFNSVSIEVPPLLTQDELEGAGTDVEQPTATITVTVFTYKGG